MICEAGTNEKDPLSQLSLELLQTVAICELMLRQWVEPPAPSSLDLSTIAHQMISTVAETGAIDAATLHHRLCREGPFVHFDKPKFAAVLRNQGAVDILEQGPDGSLILGLEGSDFGRRRTSTQLLLAASSSRLSPVIALWDRCQSTLFPKLGSTWCSLRGAGKSSMSMPPE